MKSLRPKASGGSSGFLAVLMDEQGGEGVSPRMITWSPTRAPNGRNSIDNFSAAFDTEFIRSTRE